MQFSFALIAAVAGLELTADNWDSAVAGKTVFIKFLAPWWGHCKKMKPDWDALIEEFDGHATTLIADVDCTTEGKSICEKAGVRGYPTIKHGDPNDMEDYKGGRDLDSLKAFAADLKPSCSPAQIDLCDDEKKAKIEEIQAMAASDLEEKIDEGERSIRRAEAKFKKRTEKLQQKYQEFEKEKEQELAAVKDGGLGLMKSVKAHKDSSKGEL